MKDTEQAKHDNTQPVSLEYAHNSSEEIIRIRKIAWNYNCMSVLSACNLAAVGLIVAYFFVECVTLISDRHLPWDTDTVNIVLATALGAALLTAAPLFFFAARILSLLNSNKLEVIFLLLSIVLFPFSIAVPPALIAKRMCKRFFKKHGIKTGFFIISQAELTKITLTNISKIVPIDEHGPHVHTNSTQQNHNTLDKPQVLVLYANFLRAGIFTFLTMAIIYPTGIILGLADNVSEECTNTFIYLSALVIIMLHLIGIGINLRLARSYSMSIFLWILILLCPPVSIIAAFRKSNAYFRKNGIQYNSLHAGKDTHNNKESIWAESEKA